MQILVTFPKSSDKALSKTDDLLLIKPFCLLLILIGRIYYLLKTDEIVVFSMSLLPPAIYLFSIQATHGMH